MTPPRLPSQEFERMFPDTELDTGKALYVLHRYYCGPMNKQNKCTKNCNDCQANLAVIVAYDPNQIIRNRYALLTWMARTKIAEIEEQKEIPVGPRVDWLGRRDETNPFLAVLEEL
jgi:hypothetical protein